MGYSKRQIAVRLVCLFFALSIALHWSVGRSLFLLSDDAPRNGVLRPTRPPLSSRPPATFIGIREEQSSHATAALLPEKEKELFDVSAIQRNMECEPSTVELATRHADTDSSPREGPSAVCCRAVTNDQDHGKTLSHLIKRLYCQKYATAASSAASAAAGDASIDPPVMRILQVGANTGDNANDHLVTFLRRGLALGVLMEPVPWLFRGLSRTYAEHRKTVHLVNAAMSEVEGNVSFMAPLESAKGWIPQMGGLKLPPKTFGKMKKTKQLGMFEEITVRSWSFEGLMKAVDWTITAPDVAVVDAEGFDAVLIGMILSGVKRLYGEEARIPIVQYEWKHLEPAVRVELHKTLSAAGYCVVQVHYDDIATHRSLSPEKEEMCAQSYNLRPHS